MKLNHSNRRQLSRTSLLLGGMAIMQATSTHAQDSIEEWYESRPPAQLCELYRSGSLPPDLIPGGRSSDPCSNFPDEES